MVEYDSETGSPFGAPDSPDASARRRSLCERRPGETPQQASAHATTSPTEARIIVGASTGGGNEAELRDMADSEQDLCTLLIRLQDHHWRIRKADIEILLRPDGSDYLLGEGAHAKVYRGILNKSVPVAIKTIADERQYAKKWFIEEIVCLMNLRHANVIQFYGAVIEDDCLLLICELLARGSLFDAISKDHDGKLSWYKRGRQIALDVVRGIMHMHCQGFVHQDLKSKNILLAKDYTAKVADMGLFGEPSQKTERTIRNGFLATVGTVEWTSPEVLTGGSEQISEKSDIFSLGVCIGEIITQEPPRGRSLHIKSPEQAPQEVADMVYRCLDDDPDARPTIHDVFSVLSEHQPPRTRPLEARKLSGAL